MEEIRFSIPAHIMNRLNNFYLENFEYDVYTQIQNFILSEYERSMGYSESVPVEHPLPSIHKSKEKYFFRVLYPDGSKLQIYHKDYFLLVDLWNEWSKYGFSKDAYTSMLIKFECHTMLGNISKTRGKYQVRKFGKDDERISFGTYTSLEDAYTVKCFLDDHDWDEKYSASNLVSSIEGCTKMSTSKFMLKIAEGEYVL